MPEPRTIEIEATEWYVYAPDKPSDAGVIEVIGQVRWRYRRGYCWRSQGRSMPWHDAESKDAAVLAVVTAWQEKQETR